MVNKQLLILALLTLVIASTTNAYITNQISSGKMSLNSPMYLGNFTFLVWTTQYTLPAGDYTYLQHTISLHELWDSSTSWYANSVEINAIQYLNLPTETVCWNAFCGTNNATLTQNLYHKTNGTDGTETKYDFDYASGASRDFGNCVNMRDGDTLVVTAYTNDTSPRTASCQLGFTYKSWDETNALGYLQELKSNQNYVRGFNNFFYLTAEKLNYVAEIIVELWYIAYWMFKLLAFSFVLGVAFYAIFWIYKLIKVLVES